MVEQAERAAKKQDKLKRSREEAARVMRLRKSHDDAKKAAEKGGSALEDVHEFVEHFTSAVEFVCCVVSATESHFL